MPIDFNRYDTIALLGVMEEVEPIGNYFRNLGFGTTLLSDRKHIDFEKITNLRKIAPLVVPTAQGRPIYEEAGEVRRFEPAYIKPKDAVTPHDHMVKKVGELALPQERSLQQRFDAQVGRIAMKHREAIERRWEIMAAEAIIDGQVTLTGEDYPTTVVNFQRDPSHTIVLAGNARWDQSGADILGNLNDWIRQMHLADFGGAANRLTMGANAWAVLQKDPEVREQLDTRVRGTQGDLTTGLIAGDDVVFVGRLGQLDLYVYRDYYQDENGNTVEILDPNAVVLTSSGIQGVQAFGAIQDVQVMNAMQIHTKMFEQHDPSAMFILSQSAPLMIPVNPNCTMKITVL